MSCVEIEDIYYDAVKWIKLAIREKNYPNKNVNKAMFNYKLAGKCRDELRKHPEMYENFHDDLFRKSSGIYENLDELFREFWGRT